MSSNKALSLTTPQSRRECFSIWLLNTTYINDNTVSLETSTAWLDSSRKRRSPIPGYFLIFISKYLPTYFLQRIDESHPFVLRNVLRLALWWGVIFPCRLLINDLNQSRERLLWQLARNGRFIFFFFTNVCVARYFVNRQWLITVPCGG